MPNKLDWMTVIRQRCAVTMFDMNIELHRDGRERGLWIFLKDESDGRMKQNKLWIDQNSKGFTGILAYRVNEGALLEWPAIEEFYKAMGKAIKDGKLAAKKRERLWLKETMARKKHSTRRASSSSTSKQKSKRKTSATRKKARSISRR